MTAPAPDIPRSTDSSLLLQRIAQGDETAIEGCLNAHGSLVWSIARRLSHGRAEAEEATSNIFKNVWRFAGRFESSGLSEKEFILIMVKMHFGKPVVHRHQDSLLTNKQGG